MISIYKEIETLMIRRGLEASVAGVALVLILANFHSSGWTNSIRVSTPYSPRAAVSRVYSMAALDIVPSIVVYVTVPNKETGYSLLLPLFHNPKVHALLSSMFLICGLCCD